MNVGPVVIHAASAIFRGPDPLFGYHHGVGGAVLDTGKGDPGLQRPDDAAARLPGEPARRPGAPIRVVRNVWRRVGLGHRHRARPNRGIVDKAFFVVGALVSGVVGPPIVNLLRRPARRTGVNLDDALVGRSRGTDIVGEVGAGSPERLSGHHRIDPRRADQRHDIVIGAAHQVAVVRFVQTILFDERQDLECPASGLALHVQRRIPGVVSNPESMVGGQIGKIAPALNGRRGEAAVGVVEIVNAQANLFEIVGALRPVGRLADLLHGGKQQGDQNTDDRNDDKQFDEREAESLPQS